MSMLNMLLGSGAKTELKWSGNAIATYSSWYEGLEVSNNTFRYTSNIYSVSSGSWVTVSSSGNFSGNSGIAVMSATGYIETSNNLIRVSTPAMSSYGSWITYDVSTKTFSTTTSTCYDANDDSRYLIGASGLLAYRNIYGGISPYISLT